METKEYVTPYSSIKDRFLEELGLIKSTVELNTLRARYIGKNGAVTTALKTLAGLPVETRGSVGKLVNEDKTFITATLKEKEDVLKKLEISKKIASDKIDITLPGYYKKAGGRHPVSIVMKEIVDVFVSMGFSIEEGPEVETDYYNFEALNMPKDHPARDMQDTFYISTNTGGTQEGNVLLRTHTSPVQIRAMQHSAPPLRFIAPGKVYRCDSDITHTPMFHQIEGLVVDTKISFANLKAVLEGFLQLVFDQSLPVRFRPSFFPFTEPSTEVDIGCFFCKQSGCRICKGTGWIEVLGAGMVNPKVFQMVGYDTERYCGFAFGMGIERITMLKYGIDDIRLFYEGDLRFLRQF
ncbi:phenylalanyl-tRNA synthetase, alpha subunit [Candidatus Magnetobacterium bavaricum]|uniref:Phenylalanine--tRNA ligase alpha subunit n=1 Tax=Candidatus Magnetobacterium bavaricum TaxID=29290 RepID=A0A0F3H3A5_9BACT|nr:phenylalanyl-tRNA synthetase, alpha subunit [Candidatus Magnetobacterium bavaricum]